MCDVRTGNIYEDEQLKKMEEEDKAKLKLLQMKLAPTKKQMDRVPAKVGRNEPCPCGSGKKFKRCHFEHPSGTT